MTTLPVTLLNAPESRRRRALWACAMYDAENGNTKALQKLVADGPIPKAHRAAVAALIASVPAPRKGQRSRLGSADVIVIHDFWNTTAKGWKREAAARALSENFPGVSVGTILDVLDRRGAFKWVRVLRYREAVSTATFTIGGTSAGTVSPRRRTRL